MNEAKPFASLSSNLLARKGQAKPAMRRQQGFHVGHEPHVPLTPVPVEHDDLGWNDMGHDSVHPAPAEYQPAPPAQPVALRPEFKPEPQQERPPVVDQQEKLAREFAPAVSPALAPAPARSPRAAPGAHGKAAFTLRLDGERHLRLRLVCAVQHRSAQQIVTQALDEFLARQPDNATLAGKPAR